MFRVIGIVYNEDEKRRIEYGEFAEYSDAYDYAEYLENPDNWNNNNLPGQPLTIHIEEY